MNCGVLWLDSTPVIGAIGRLPHKAAHTTQVWVISLEEFANTFDHLSGLNYFCLAASHELLLDSGQQERRLPIGRAPQRHLTMTKKLTTLLLISLMLALPLRVVAGVAMFGCAVSHHASAGQMSQEMAGESMAGCHSAGHGDTAPSHGNCHENGDTPTKHAGSTCSACGDCCVGALSIPAGVQTLFDRDLASSLISLPDAAYVGFQPQGLDRPPRNAVL